MSTSAMPNLTMPGVPCRKKPKTDITLCTVVLRLGCGMPPGEGEEYIRWTPNEMGPNGVTEVDDVTISDVITAASSTATDQKYNGRSCGFTVQLQSGIDECKLLYLTEGIETPDIQNGRGLLNFGDRTGQSVVTVHAEFWFYNTVNGAQVFQYMDFIPEATIKRNNRSGFSSGQTNPTVEVMLMGMPVDDVGTRKIREYFNCSIA